MPTASHFYNSTTRKYIALFGTIFNKMVITRDTNEGTQVQKMIVPISYGPYQKFLAKLDQDPDLDRKTAITLPRMAFEIVAMNYDGTRKTGSLNKMRSSIASTDDSTASVIYSPAPYNIEFNLYIMTKYTEDGSKIVEQILPFFKPELTTTVHLIDGIDPVDIPLVLTSISSEDVYESDFDTRRSLIWTLSFTMKGYFYGPARKKKIIKFVDVRMMGDVETNSPALEVINIQPGLTVGGNPTSDIEQTIPYQDINFDDDWSEIVTIRQYDETIDDPEEPIEETQP